MAILGISGSGPLDLLPPQAFSGCAAYTRKLLNNSGCIRISLKLSHYLPKIEFYFGDNYAGRH